MAREDKSVLMENVKIIFRNFAGAKSKFNQEGDRNFCVLLTHEMAQELDDGGWNVKVLNPRDDAEEDELPQPYLPVSVNFRGRPPRVVMITSRGRTPLDENTVELLDLVDILQVDLIVNPYEWEVNGRTGIKAYLKTLFVTIREDALELKYSDMQDASEGMEVE